MIENASAVILFAYLAVCVIRDTRKLIRWGERIVGEMGAEQWSEANVMKASSRYWRGRCFRQYDQAVDLGRRVASAQSQRDYEAERSDRLAAELQAIVGLWDSFDAVGEDDGPTEHYKAKMDAAIEHARVRLEKDGPLASAEEADEIVSRVVRDLSSPAMDCPMCGGTGDGYPDACPACGGSGEMAA